MAMTSDQRTALGITATVLIVGGLAGVVYYLVKKESSITTWPLPFPTTNQEAASTLTQLNVLWWQAAATNAAQTPLMQQYHAEAAAIRQQFPNTGVPTNGYTCTQLVSMGQLSSAVCSAAQANGWLINNPSGQ